MNQEKQRIATAEACGWELSPDGKKWRTPYKSSYRFRRKIGDQFYYTNEVHDYLNNLNAMHEAVETLRHKDGPEWFDFQKHLMDICGSTMNCIQATAAQRAESFLKTLGLWTEEE